MKKLLCLLVLFVASVLACAQSPAYIYTLNATLAWDTTPTQVWIDINSDGVGDVDGTGKAIVENVTSVLYEVGYSIQPISNRTTVTQVVGSTATLQMPIAVPPGGWVVYAVRAIYTTASGVSRSVWNWSDLPEGTGGSPFWYANPSLLLSPPPMGFVGT